MRFKCLIVEDEPLAQEILESYAADCPDLELVGKCSNAFDAIKILGTDHIDILFLDIQLPELDGISFLKGLKEKPITIFTTAFREYALAGFELGVIDYLVKPVENTRFIEAITRATDFLKLKEIAFSVSGTGRSQEILKVKTGFKCIDIVLDEVTHVQGLKDYAIVFTKKEKYVLKGSVKHIQQLLPKLKFIRVHKSFIVSKKLIRSVYKGRIEFDNHKIPIGRVYKQEVDQLINDGRLK